jgi:hypothetical protein
MKLINQRVITKELLTIYVHYTLTVNLFVVTYVAKSLNNVLFSEWDFNLDWST